VVLTTSAGATLIFLAALWLPGHFRWSYVEGPGMLVMITLALVAVLDYPSDQRRAAGPVDRARGAGR
jgi:hypothetical protein